MHIKVDAATLASELALAMGAVEKRTTIPILANVLLRAGAEGLAICATDLEIAFAGFVDADVRTKGAVALPARKLLEYVRQLQGELEIKVSDKFWASMTCGKSKQRLAGMAPDAWPEVPEFASVAAESPASKLAAAFGAVLHAVDEQPQLRIPAGALLEIADGSWQATSSDGRRAARSVFRAEASGPFKVIVPRRAMVEVSRMPAEDAESIQIGEDDNHILFNIGRRRIVARRLMGNFPDIGRSFPKSYAHFVEFGASELSAAIGRVYGLSDERTRRITITMGPQCVVSSDLSDLGQCEEEIDGSCDIAPVTFGISANFLLEAVKACKAGRVRIQFESDNRKPLHIAPVDPVDGVSFFAVIAPML